MNKAEYMNQLKTALDGFPGEVQEELLWEYEGKFIDGLVAGKSEQEIAAILPKPELIAARKKAQLRYRELAAGFSFDRFMKLFFALIGLAICNVVVMISALVYFSFLFTAYMLALTLYISGILISGAGIAKTEQVNFHVPWTNSEREYQEPVVVELNVNGIQINGKQFEDEELVRADVPHPATSTRSATRNTPVHLTLNRQFGWPDVWKGLGLVTAGILLFLLSLLVTRWTWYGCKNYWRWNLKQLRFAEPV